MRLRRNIIEVGKQEAARLDCLECNISHAAQQCQMLIEADALLIFFTHSIRWRCNAQLGLLATHQPRHILRVRAIATQQPVLANLPQLPAFGAPLLLQFSRTVYLCAGVFWGFLAKVKR